MWGVRRERSNGADEVASGFLFTLHEKVTSSAAFVEIGTTQFAARGARCCRFSAEAGARGRTPRTWTRSPPRPTCRRRPRCPSRWRRRWRGTPIARGAWRGNRKGGFWRRAHPTGPRVCGRPRGPPAARGSPSPSSRACTTEPCDPSRGLPAVRPRGARTHAKPTCFPSHRRAAPRSRRASTVLKAKRDLKCVSGKETTKRRVSRFACARAPATLTFTITKNLFRRPHARDGFFRRVHRGVGRARRGLGVRRRGGGARKRGQVVRLVAQRRAPGDVRPRQDGVDLGGPARVRLRVRRGNARARAGREAGALAPHRGRAGVGVLRRRDPRVGGGARRRRLVVRARCVGEGRGAHQHGLERGVRGVNRSDGRPKRRAEDGDVLGRQEHRRVGRERCAARPRDLKARRFLFFWFFWFFCSRDGKRMRRAKPGGAGQTVESGAL